MDNNEAWLLLNKIKGLGIVKIKKLLTVHETAENILKQKNFPDFIKLNNETKEAIIHASSDLIRKDLEWLAKDNNSILSIDNDLYPPLLKKSDSPPPLLYITGNPNILLQPQLAVVGSRNATSVGLKNTYSFCSTLAANGLTITSGMALGVDGTAHKAAIEAKGTTVAVMGNGLDTVYPAKHRDLAHLIAQNGALISEFYIGTKPHHYNFPRRNRIICGLSLGTLVIEAGLQSGTLITARQTMENNRPVMAIPGSIHSPLAKGCHFLIKQGAKLIESAGEIIEELTPLAHGLTQDLTEKYKSLDGDKKEQTSKHEHQNILDAIEYEPTSINQIIEKTGLNIAELSSVLLILELEDKIQTLAGAHYIRV